LGEDARVRYMLELLVRGVKEDLKQIGVAATAATILRRTTPHTADYTRMPNAWFWREDGLHADIVLPVIAEVKNVKDMCSVVRQHGRKPHPRFPNDFPGAVVTQVGSSISSAIHDVFVQMIVFPAHGNLQNATELLERGHRGYFNAPPDKRLNLPERNM
jgi:hypothetical protein